MQITIKLAALGAAVVALSGCATIIEGTSQEIMVVTNPPGATCVLEREGQAIASISSTPSAALIKKTKHDIMIRCNRPGFEEAVFLDHSGLASGSVAGNVAADLLLTGGLSSIIDSASGADNKYDSPVNITMIPKSAMPMASAPAPVPATTPAASTSAAQAPAASGVPAGTIASTPVADEKPAKPAKPAAATH